MLAVDGTPADCVNLAIVKLLPRRPDARGLGHQPRRQPRRRRLLLGHGGRRARGHVLRRPRDRLLARRAGRTSTTRPRPRSRARLAGLVIERGLPERTLLNVNVPAGHARRASPSPCRAAASTRARSSRASTRARRTYYWIEEGRDQLGERRDVRHLRRAPGLISVTPAADRHHEPPRGPGACASGRGSSAARRAATLSARAWRPAGAVV